MGILSSAWKAVKGVAKSVFTGGGLLGGPSVFGGIVGNVLGGIGSSIIGSRLNRRADQRAMKQQFDFYKNQGATLSEIMGNGGVSGDSGNGQAIMGNQLNQVMAQKRQQNFEMREREKDRAIQLASIEAGMQNQATAANAQMQSAGMAASANRYSADQQFQTALNRLNLDRDRFSKVDLPKAWRDSINEDPERVKQRIMAQMSADNMFATAVGHHFGVDPFEGVKGASKEELMEMARYIYGVQSTLFSNSAGASVAVDDGVRSLGNAGRQMIDNTLGDQGFLDNMTRRLFGTGLSFNR